ncbi:hypothetical protein [Jiangella alkaliphila]|uniref:Uncharacterized protein n=1 Tax=Jiangella alkaliphila TaxID=419479 RepID=A0A1H2KD68_9ACTN|nr:hypothetical protein [Jiangella alkaliphila]SDU66552.1 hypothetical protein SAMN04488563_3691 [Jiangella alkaliphila]
MAVGRAARRAARAPAVERVMGPAQVDVALDLLELTELAWHDCYGELTPSDQVVDDMLVCSRGELAGLVRAARLGTTDWRDLRMEADAIRAEAAG